MIKKIFEKKLSQRRKDAERKKGRRKITFVLCSLFIVLCFAGCDLFEQPVKAEEGVGYVSLSVGGGGAARTITPVFSTDLFAEFTVEIFTTGTTSNPAVSHQRIVLANINKPIALTAGSYDLYVKAYTKAGDTTAATEGNVKNVAVTAGQTISQNIDLNLPDEAILAAMGSGTGSFGWNIGFSADRLEMTVSKYADGSIVGSTQTGTSSPWSGSIADLPVGFYRVLFRQYSGTNPVLERREILHIYEGRESRFDVVFSAELATIFLVTNGNDSGAGSLRQAISDAPDGSVIVIDPSVGTITLTARLSFLANQHITIEGNGTVITRASTFTVNSASQLMNLPWGINATAVIRRVHFKDGRATSNGGAIDNAGNLTLESCIFSGNQNSGTTTQDGGGALYARGGDLTVRGCTFYDNKMTGATGRGGAIHVQSGTATLAGNLFYGNTASTGPVLNRYGGTVTSLGYNVVDVAFGTGSTQSGFAATSGDKIITALPMSPASFRLLSDSGAANVISTLSENYPTHDFYGNPIPQNGAAVGAVQSAAGAGYVLALGISENHRTRGSVAVSPDNPDWVFTGDVTLTAKPEDGFSVYWLVNGVRSGETNTLQLTMDKPYTVQAVFWRIWEVTAATSAAASASAATGSLGWAVFNAQNYDVIELNVPGKVIELSARIVLYADRNITIEGNGTVITRAGSFAASATSQLMNLPTGAAATIRRVHFKDGRATENGAAIDNRGNLTLESCIFSGNQNSSDAGTIYTNATLNVRGCTFYDNKATGARSYGAAISGPVNLVGNLFYGNTSYAYPVVYYYYAAMNSLSLGYNVVDVALGTGTAQSGFSAATGDVTISEMPLAPSFRMLPGSGAVNVVTTLPAGYPAFDFYGAAITAPANAGAVQSLSAAGFGLSVSVNDSARGTVTPSQQPNLDGILPAHSSVTLTAAPQSGMSVYWLVNEVRNGETNTLQLTMDKSYVVQAVFYRKWIVTAATSAAVPANQTAADAVQGTLGWAVFNAQNDDVIELNVPGKVIDLSARIVLFADRNIIIEGNGTVITRAGSFAASTTSQLMNLPINAAATIRRVHFKDGRATDYGGAINNSGYLTLESCIFSGNQTSNSGARGGALYNGRTANIRGCTFYNNSTTGSGGAIYVLGDVQRTAFAGNLFYGNTATTNPVLYYAGGSTLSLGYNLVDVALGIGAAQSGFPAFTGDVQFTDVGFANNTTLPFNATTFVPVATGTLRSHIPNPLPDALRNAGFPTTDFNGATRTWPGAPGAVKQP